MALWTLREANSLPPVELDDCTAKLDLLVGQPDRAVAESTRLWNQIHSLLLQLDPEYKKGLPSLRSRTGSLLLCNYQTRSLEPLQQQRAAAVQRLAQRLCLAMEHVKELEHQIRKQVESRFAPLMRIGGIGSLTAGALAGILGPGRRFTTDSQLAAYAGAAPLEASSAADTSSTESRR